MAKIIVAGELPRPMIQGEAITYLGMQGYRPLAIQAVTGAALNSIRSQLYVARKVHAIPRFAGNGAILTDKIIPA